MTTALNREKPEGTNPGHLLQSLPQSPSEQGKQTASLWHKYMPEDDWKISIGELLNYQNKVSPLPNPRQAGGSLLFGYVSVSFDFSRVTSLPIKQHYPAAWRMMMLI